MIVKCLEINEDLQLVPYPQEKAVAAAELGQVTIWLDLEGPESDDELDKWLGELGVSPLFRHLLTAPHDRSGYYPLQDELLFVLPFIHHSAGSEGVVYASFLCKNNLLLTLHGQSISELQQTDILLESTSWIPGRSITGLISALLIGTTLKTLDRVTTLRNSTFIVEQKMESDPDTVEIEDIMDLRSELLINEVLASDSLPTLAPLSLFDKPFFKTLEAHEYLSCALGNMKAVEAGSVLLRARIQALHDGFDTNVQNKTNRRLNMLTVLSAIFMPITLLAGIWGMNFETMPELAFNHGYPMGLGLMLVIGLWMLWLFRKGGWFD